MQWPRELNNQFQSCRPTIGWTNSTVKKWDWRV